LFPSAFSCPYETLQTFSEIYYPLRKTPLDKQIQCMSIYNTFPHPFFHLINFNILIEMMQTNVFFGRNFTKFQPEKYDFNLYKEFSMEENGLNSIDFKEILF
jgi:hypothetical protein